jgi:hypothetical protein
MAENKTTFGEGVKYLTPILVTIALFMIGGMRSDMTKVETSLSAQISSVDIKLFKHLTNDEIHTPKSIVISKPEFTIYQTMRDKQMSDIKEMITDVRADLKCVLRDKSIKGE